MNKLNKSKDFIDFWTAKSGKGPLPDDYIISENSIMVVE